MGRVFLFVWLVGFFVLFCRSFSPEKISASNIIQMEQVIYNNTYVYSCTYTHKTTINKKEAMNFKRSREGVWEALGL